MLPNVSFISMVIKKVFLSVSIATISNFLQKCTHSRHNYGTSQPKIVWPKILKGNHCILRIQGAPVRQKLGMILENKVVQKLKFEKNVFLQKMVSQIDILRRIFF